MNVFLRGDGFPFKTQTSGCMSLFLSPSLLSLFPSILILLLLLFPLSLPLFGSPPHLLPVHPLLLGGQFNTNILYRPIALGSSQGLAPAFTSFIPRGDYLAIMTISTLPRKTLRAGEFK